MSSFWIEFAFWAGLLSLFCLLPAFWFWRTMAVERKLFTSLTRGADRRAASNGSPWLGWVDRRFPGQHFMREDALKEYDTKVASLLPFLMLRAFLPAAPLCGVLITMYKLLSLKVDPGADGGENFLREAAAPLFVGVGSGAFAALVCQACWVRANRSWAKRETRPSTGSTTRFGPPRSWL